MLDAGMDMVCAIANACPELMPITWSGHVRCRTVGWAGRAYALPIDIVGSVETTMTRKKLFPVPKPIAEHAQTPTPSNLKMPPVEPVEVLGSHKNSAQKSHRGAR